MFLLDTCTFLWLGLDQESLSQKAKQLIETCQESLFISSISAFEIARKHSIGKLDLPVPPTEWIEGISEFYGIDTLPISLAIASRAATLPPFHKDPCDRMIIATAIENTMTIVTPDPMIAKYDIKIAW